MAKPFPEPRYLGDGVYVSVNDMPALVITTEHHAPDKADNTVVLENDVVNALKRYIKDIEESQI